MPSSFVPPELVTILANPTCPHCLQATETLTDWCCEEGIPVAGVDLIHHPEVGERWHIEHSPAIIIERPGSTPLVVADLPDHAAFLRLTRGS